MTVSMVAAPLYPRFDASLLHEYGYIKVNLNASRFCRRLHAVPEAVWQIVCGLLA
jgi:hypothetical protein